MFNLVKGTHDVILDEAQKYTYIENVLQNTAQLFGYKEFRTPIIAVILLEKKCTLLKIKVVEV